MIGRSSWGLQDANDATVSFLFLWRVVELVSVPSAEGQNKARRNWHDEHKRNVWRRLHPEDFQEDRPIIEDPDAFRY